MKHEIIFADSQYNMEIEGWAEFINKVNVYQTICKCSIESLYYFTWAQDSQVKVYIAKYFVYIAWYSYMWNKKNAEKQ